MNRMELGLVIVMTRRDIVEAALCQRMEVVILLREKLIWLVSWEMVVSYSEPR